MKKILCLFMLGFCLIFNYNDIDEFKSDALVDDLMVDMSNYNMKDIPLGEYLEGVISCEMPVLFQDEALKAGVVSARTYYLYHYYNRENYKPSNGGQCYLSSDDLESRWGSNYTLYSTKIKDIVRDTKNQVITYDGDIILSYYFSMSNGYTEDASYVFSESKPYLVSVSSEFDKSLVNNVKKVSISLDEFKDTLLIDGEVDVNNISRNESNRVIEVCINSKCYSGLEIRKMFNLRSTDFDIVIDKEVNFVTRGYGHGVGLSQYGANEMAKLGYKYQDILKYYYKDTKIVYK